MIRFLFPHLIGFVEKGEKPEPREIQISETETKTDDEIQEDMKKLFYKYLVETEEDKKALDKYFSND